MKKSRIFLVLILAMVCILMVSCGRTEEPQITGNENLDLSESDKPALPESIPDTNLLKYIPDFDKAEKIVVEYAAAAKGGVAVNEDYVPLNDDEWEVMKQWLLAGNLSEFSDASKIGTEGEAALLECRIEGELCRLTIMANDKEQYVSVRMSGMHEVFIKGPAETFNMQMLNGLIQAAADNMDDRLYSGLVTDLKKGETYRISKKATVRARNYLDNLILTSETEIDPDDEKYQMELIVENTRYLINTDKGYLKRQTGGKSEYGREKHGMTSFITTMWNLDKP